MVRRPTDEAPTNAQGGALHRHSRPSRALKRSPGEGRLAPEPERHRASATQLGEPSFHAHFLIGQRFPAQAGEPEHGHQTLVHARVYPRAGGGTTAAIATPKTIKGLSPRRRGNLGVGVLSERLPGSIPAQAGEPSTRTDVGSLKGVYPRAGGGTSLPVPPVIVKTGLSPRRRGNQQKHTSGHSKVGSIPAQAGEPDVVEKWKVIGRVYPRAGGGTVLLPRRQ